VRKTIAITNGTMTVEMPKVKAVEVGAVEVAISKQMASGKIVKDVTGYRPTILASWDFVPADTITNLLTLLRSGSFFTVLYPAPTGDESGIFSITYPTLGLFSFIGGIPVWHNVTLSMEGQVAE